MRLAFAAVALACSGPALATGGISCRPVQGTGPTLHLVIGHAVAPSIVSVRMGDGVAYNSGNERMGSHGLAIARSWLDDRILWLDLADPNLTRFEGRLRAVFQPKVRGRPAVGTFVRNGRTWRVRCVEA
ncbi:MAG TPA: hypothetical protein VEA61_12980 [Allosphingosinicella sp.]|nr:hypothetical protein [Allosphingosinicella sp.]